MDGIIVFPRYSYIKKALVEVGSEPVFIFVKQNHSEADEIKGGNVVKFDPNQTISFQAYY